MRAFARQHQSALDEKFVESEFQKVVPFANTHPRSAPRRRATKVPAPAPVQSGKASANKSLTRILSRFSTEFPTLGVKNFSISPRRPEPSIDQTKAARQAAFFVPFRNKKSASNLFQKLLV